MGRPIKRAQIIRNKRMGRQSAKEMCEYFGFFYADPLGQEDGRDELLRITLENKRVARTALKKIFDQAWANTPAGWFSIVTIRPHGTRPHDAYVVLSALDFQNILVQLRENQ